MSGGSGENFLNYSSCSLAAQLLSIPSQQPDPPKHSTPKSGEDNYRPAFDVSSICEDFERKSNVSSAGEQRQSHRAPLVSEKERVCSFLENEIQKRRISTSSTVLKETTLNVLNRRITGRDELPSSSRDTTSTSVPLRDRKMLKFETPHLSRPQSSVSDTDSMSTRKLAFERGKDKLNFYCVQIGESLVLRHRVWNVDSVQMRLRCSIVNENGIEHPNFKIIEVTAPIMEPGSQCEIAVQYTPTKVERNFAHLMLERVNGECFRKTFQLLGYGGAAEVGLSATNLSDGIAKQATSSQAIVIRPDNSTHFWLEFENRGQRSAFVKLMATSRNGKSLPNGHVCIRPEQFVLDAHGGPRDQWKVSVRISESFDWIGETSTVTDGRQQQLQPPAKERISSASGKRVNNSNHQRESIATGRDSILTSCSSAITAHQQPECAFRIEAFWGEEYQRQRLICWQRRTKQPTVVRGVSFTSGLFEGEHQTSGLQFQKICAALTECEIAEFHNSLRQTTFNVICVQTATHLPSEQPDFEHPLIGMYRNQSRLLREALLEEEC